MRKNGLTQISFLTILLLTVITGYSCKEQAIQYNDPIPDHEILKLNSSAVSEERVISIYTPPGYSTSTDSFPVLYMPDGGIKEDFPHIANTLDTLIKQGKIPAYILVGIENTERGRDLTGASAIKEHEEYGIPMTDGAKNFRAFIIDELIPVINERYRTTGYQGIIGESLAGLFVVETMMLRPEAFNFFIAMDPSIWWNDNITAKNAKNNFNRLPDRRTKLWFAGSGNAEISTRMEELIAQLKAHAPDNLEWTYSPEPSEEHHTIFRATKEKALIWSMND